MPNRPFSLPFALVTESGRGVENTSQLFISQPKFKEATDLQDHVSSIKELCQAIG